jgi:N-acetylglutamate synthase-like GNAT family acetyltransferase
MGVASRLLSEMETRARALGAKRLYTQASLTAYGFFQRRGFKLVRAQDVELRGVQLRNFIMERSL